MPELTDPMQGLISLQEEVSKGTVPFKRCELHSDLQVHLDFPLGELRITYARMRGDQVLGMVSFVKAEPVNGVPCFSIGYAVAERERKRGIATEIVDAAIQELHHGVAPKGVDKFYVEAVVGTENVPSNRLAARLLSSSPTDGTDEFSGVPVRQYLKLIT